jgi:hypothetical protein
MRILVGKSLKERNNFEDLGTDRKIILTQILKKYDKRVRTD